MKYVICVVPEDQAVGEVLGTFSQERLAPLLERPTAVPAEPEERGEVRMVLPHKWQNGPDATKAFDCGPTCVAMAVWGMTHKRPSVDEISAVADKRTGWGTTFDQLDVALRHYGLDGIHERPLRIEGIKRHIDAGRPVILLVSCGRLPKRYTSRFTTFKGAHFVLAVGYDDERVFVHDPLNKKGANVSLLFNELDYAMAQSGGGNLPYQGMYVVKR